MVRLALARHMEKYPPRETILEDRTDPRKVTQRTAELLFLTVYDRPLPPVELVKSLDASCPAK